MKKKAKIIGFCITWFAIITQFASMTINRQTDVQEAIIRFFSFLTNTLTALFFTCKIKRKMNIFNNTNRFTHSYEFFNFNREKINKTINH